MARMSRRVMNLAHHGDPERPPAWRPHRLYLGRHDPGPGARSTAAVSALAAALSARGIVKGDRILVHSKNCDEMFWSMFAAFRLGAVWVPTNFRLMPDEVAYLATASGAKGFCATAIFPIMPRRPPSPALEFIWRIGEGRRSARQSVSEAIAAHAGARGRECRGRL